MLLFLLSNSALHNWDIPKANFCYWLTMEYFRLIMLVRGLLNVISVLQYAGAENMLCGEYAVKIRPVSPIVFISPHC